MAHKDLVYGYSKDEDKLDQNNFDAYLDWVQPSLDQF